MKKAKLEPLGERDSRFVWVTIEEQTPFMAVVARTREEIPMLKILFGVVIYETAAKDHELSVEGEP